MPSTVFLLRDWESARLRSARLEQARPQTELESLGREVDPHFLFNNLNALAHLVDQRSDAAPRFIRTLSATYRYVLQCRRSFAHGRAVDRYLMPATLPRHADLRVRST